MLIKEALSRFEATSNNIFEKAIKAVQLKNYLLNLKKKDRNLSFLIDIILLNYDGILCPASVQNICSHIGLHTIEDIDKFLKSANWDKIYNLLNIKLDISNLQKQIRSFIMNAVYNSQWNLTKNCYWNFGDINYYILNQTILKNLLHKCPYNNNKYIAESYDCEDFARTTKAWVTLHCVGNISFGNAEAHFYYNSTYKFTHGFNIAVLDDGGVVLIEPQSDFIIDSPTLINKWFHNCNNLKIYFIQF